MKRSSTLRFALGQRPDSLIWLLDPAKGTAINIDVVIEASVAMAQDLSFGIWEGSPSRFEAKLNGRRTSRAHDGEVVALA